MSTQNNIYRVVQKKPGSRARNQLERLDAAKAATSLPLPTGSWQVTSTDRVSIIIVSTSPIEMNENIKRNHKDTEWKQLFFEIPFFFGPPCT